MKQKPRTKLRDLRNWIKGFVKNVVVHAKYSEDRNGKLTQIGHKFTINFKLAIFEHSLKYGDEKHKNSAIKLLRDKNKCLNYNESDVKKSGEDLNENETYNKRSNSQLFSHCRINH